MKTWRAMWYGPEFANEGPLLVERLIAPGILGYTVERYGHLYVPAFRAINKGHGDGTRFVDSLQSGTRFPNVLSPRFQEFLKRRGWTMHVEIAEGAGWGGSNEKIEVWEKP